MPRYRTVVLLTFLLHGGSSATATAGEKFPPQLVDFVPFEHNPVFAGAGPGNWDVKIRERGWILREGNLYRLWYTGYNGEKTGIKQLGYATSEDGIHWKRYQGNPIYREHWVEDMMVLRDGDVYYMVAEGKGDVAQMLTSADGIHWTREGSLDVRTTNGKPLSKGPYGTPTLWLENDVWYLFYERGDQGVWLATSKDRKVWTNVSDEPVLARGPELYDRYAVALNQIVKHEGRYYAYYHGADTPEWRKWSTSVATSEDLIHWEKYLKNPILEDNKSSGILVNDGRRFRLYTMHDQVQLHLPGE